MKEDAFLYYVVTFQYIHSPKCGRALPKDVNISVPDKRGMGKGVHREAMKMPRVTKQVSSRGRNHGQILQIPTKHPGCGEISALWCKGRGRCNDMDLSLRCYAGRYNSLLYSALLFNLNAPLTLFFFVWNVIYVSVYKFAMYK